MKHLKLSQVIASAVAEASRPPAPDPPPTHDKDPNDTPMDDQVNSEK